MKATEVQKELQRYYSKEKANFFPKFFKAGPGEYAEGDKFVGATVPICRQVAKKYCGLQLNEIKKLLTSKIHEERLVALLILVDKFQKAKGDKEVKKIIYDFYLANTKSINNWDLVDLSCSKIVGQWVVESNYSNLGLLTKLARSENLWEKRIAIISTFAFIKVNRLEPTIKIARILLRDKHDLIHKAVGWMLREVGKKDMNLLEKFLKDNYSNIPRTTLRYAIEKFPEKKRQRYLKLKDQTTKIS